MTQRYPLPITSAMLTRANENEAKPRYDTATDWEQGTFGNEADVATLTSPVVGAESANTVTLYPIRNQTIKAAAMVPPLTILADIGIDYGAYTGEAGRTGTITPRAPYPAVKP